jgi:glycosyltransferase involved in cell wall biosynthesis
MLLSARQLPRYDLAIYAPGAAPLYLDDVPAVGGAERQMLMLARALARRGLRVCHVVEGLPGLPPSSHGVDLILQRPRDPGGGPRLPFLVLEALRRADASVYLQMSAGLVTGIVASHVRVRRRRFVYATSSSLDLLGGLPLSARDALLARLGLRLADAIVVQTDDQLRAAGDRRDVALIPSLCDCPPISETPRDIFLWVGRQASYKNPLAFAQLAHDVPEARFVMVGIPAPGGAPGDAALARATAEASNLEILPPLAHSQVLSLYERAVAVVNTSDFEGFPNAFMEGWARGALALSLRIDPDGVIAKHGLGVAAEGSPQVLAAAAREAWERRAEPDRRRSDAVEYVRANHSPDAVAEQWERLISSLQRRQRLPRRLRRTGPLDVYFGNASGAETEPAFYGRLQLPNRTFKTTAPNRLDDVNELVNPLLPRDRRLRVMDVAVSSGITSAEWAEQLTRRGVEHEFIAGDLALEGFLLTAGRHVAILWEQSGYPLAVQFGPGTFYVQRTQRRLPTLLLDEPLHLLYRLASRLRPAAPEAPPAPWALRARPVRLVTRRLLNDSHVRLIRDDIAQPGRFIDQIDVCRAANILNRAYFSDSEIQSMARNLVARLRSGGLLIVCRTPDDAGSRGNRTTVFRLNDGGLDVVARLNGGSEVEDLILSGSQEPAQPFGTISSSS